MRKLLKLSVASIMIGRPFTVAIEGNIASGKTTLLKYFSALENVKTLEEPVNMWRNVRGHNLLGLMYENPERWSLTFQAYVQLTMLQKHTCKVQEKFKFMERSIHSARFCFIENLHNTGRLSKPEYLVLDEWYNWLSDNVEVGVDLIVYLKTDPVEVHKRIQQRGRPEEQHVTLKYLQDLHDLHEKWLMPLAESTSNKVLVMDGNQDMNTMLGLYEECRNRIFASSVSRPPPLSPRKADNRPTATHDEDNKPMHLYKEESSPLSQISRFSSSVSRLMSLKLMGCLLLLLCPTVVAYQAFWK